MRKLKALENKELVPANWVNPSQSTL